MARLSASDRQERILRLLAQNGTARTAELAEQFGVSRETIRRDLMALSESGQVKTMFGGVVPTGEPGMANVEQRTLLRPDDKARIGRKVLELVGDRRFVYVDNGSTALACAKVLALHSGYHVITNSLLVVNALMDSQNEVSFLGGTVNSRSRCTYGLQTVSMLRQLRVDVAVLGTSGFDRHTGPSTNGPEAAQVKQEAIARAETIVVATDSSKASYSSYMQYTSWNSVDYLVSDKGLPTESLRLFGDRTHVILV